MTTTVQRVALVFGIGFLLAAAAGFLAPGTTMDADMETAPRALGLFPVNLLHNCVHLLFGSANRDPARFANPDVFDIERKDVAHQAFGGGVHYCVGNALARMEARVVFEELLKRVPNWTVDLAHANLSSTSTV